MKLVITPPPLKPAEPGLSGAAAVSRLLERGVDARWLDASIGWHRFALAPQRLQAHLAAARDLAPGVRRALEQAAESMAASPPVLRRSETYRRRGVYTSAVNVLQNALRAAAVPWPEFRLGIAMIALERPLRRLESSATLTFLAGHAGPFDAYFTEALLPAIEATGADAVALSLTFQQQTPAAFRLARLLRERLPGVRRVLGGPLVACWAAANLPLTGPVYADFDAVVAGSDADLMAFGSVSGEASLPSGHHTASERLPTDAPSACSEDAPMPPRGTAVHEDARPEARGHGGSVLAVPLEQAPWEDYLAPLPVVPAALGQGCYYRRCTFCPDHLHPPHAPCGADPLADFLHAVAARFPDGAMLHLTDSALPPGHLERVAEVIRRDRLPLSWHGFVRAEAPFAEPAFARHLAEGGCAMLQIGVESGSPRMLRRMGKGLEPAQVRRVLAATAAAGIRNHAYLLFGMPGETDADREQTLDLVRDAVEDIHALNCALLNLPIGSPMHRFADRFGITELVPFAPDTDLSLSVDFRCGASHPRPEARTWLGRRFFKDAAVKTIQGRLNTSFKANHLCFLA